MHLVMAVVARGLAEDRLSEAGVAAVERHLARVEPDYASPALDESTKKLLEEIAATDQPMRALLDRVVQAAKDAAASGAGAPDGDEGDRSAGTGPGHDSDQSAAPGGVSASAHDVGSEGLSPAQRALVSRVSVDPLSVGRGAIIHRLLAMLGARDPQPVILVGDPGSGRTSVAQALSAELASHAYSGPIARAAVHITNTSALLAQRSLGALTPLATSGVLVVDDADVVLRLGGAVDSSALASLRALVAAPGARVVLMIASASLDRFRAADPEFMSELEITRVPDLDHEDILQIAREEAASLAEHHEVAIPDSVIAAAAMPRRLSDTQSHPALAVRRLDRAAAAARLRADRKAQAGDLGSEVSSQQYVSFDPDRAHAALSARVFGQDDAIRGVTDRLAVTRAALDLRPERPDGVFLFAGPTGTGKTALALELAREIYGSPEALIRLDMSEFAERHSVSKLFGSPPGYVGSTDPDSWLTTRIRNRPQCVLLLDEIEKAHPSVWNSFLQVFDAGTLTDSLGSRAEFSEVVVIMTSNIGAEAFAERAATGFLPGEASAAAQESDVLAELRLRMRPELLNRLDATVVFRPLDEPATREIAVANLDRAVRRLEERGWKVTVTDAVEALVVERGFSREYGARPLLRVLEDLILRRLAGLPAGSYHIDAADGTTVVTPAD
jgi:ATP-dependent Clp protease ATP-binding subunit ClpA